jgi:hypothetical protein
MKGRLHYADRGCRGMAARAEGAAAGNAVDRRHVHPFVSYRGASSYWSAKHCQT